MTIDTTFVRILLVLLPGLTGRLIFERLKANRQRTVWQAFVEVFLFAFVSYVIAGVTLSAFHGSPLGGPDNIDAIYRASDAINWPELYVAVFVSVVVAVLVAWAHNMKVVNRLGRLVGITKSFGDDDVWEYIHNTPDIEWVYLRDHKQSLTYYGRISSFSDSYRPREIVLSDVVAFDNHTGEELYAVDGVYISRAQDEITIEVPVYASHVPQAFEANEYERLFGAASPAERKGLERVYVYDEDTSRYSLKGSSRPKDRISLQSLLNRERLSVIHRGRGKRDE